MQKNIWNVNILLISSLCILVLLSYACGQKKEQQAGVVATAGDEVITMFDMRNALKVLPARERGEYQSEQTLTQFLHNMVDWRLTAQAAVKAGIDRSPDIKTQLEILGDNETFKRDQILSNAYMSFRQKEIKSITDEEISDYYKSSKDEFIIPERAKIKRICFEDKQLAEAARQELQKGLSIEELIEQKPQFKRKFDSLWQHRKDSGSQMEQAVFDLNNGEVSDILTVKTGFCLVRVEEKFPARQRALDEVSKGIRARLTYRKRHNLMENIRQELRQGVNITINKALLKPYHFTAQPVQSSAPASPH